jgi:small-conductance mechanosensitive channel
VITSPPSTGSACLLVLTLVVVGLLRGRGVFVRTLSEFALLVLLGSHLLKHGASPFLVASSADPGSGLFWLRTIAVIWWLIAARAGATLTTLALGRDAKSRHARLLSDLLAGGIYLTAIVIILNSVLDLPVKGLLATSGVIAITLGLALQSTLADLFSGIATGLDQPFRVGDHIRIADHAEGKVVEINWRGIRVATDGDSLTTIPNSIVAKSQVTNHSVPSQRRRASTEIPTLSAAPAEKLLELVRQAVLLSPEILADPAPEIALKSLGLRTTTIGVSYWVGTTSALPLARGHLLRQVRRLFRHAGIGTAETDPSEPTVAPHDNARHLLGALALFETIPDDHITQLAQETRLLTYEPGDVLMEQNSLGTSLFVIRSGVFELRRGNSDATTSVLGRIGPGEYLGEVSMMSGEPRSVTAISLTAASAYELPRQALEALVRSDESLSAAVERSVQRGLQRLERDDAARAAQPLDEGGSVLQRIREFLFSPHTIS